MSLSTTSTHSNLSPLQAIDHTLFDLVSSVVSNGGRAWQNWSQMYETDVCETAGKACGQLWNPLQNPVKTLLRIAPIALAFLVVANPLGITSSFLNAIAIAFALSTTPDLFSKEGKVKLCQGGALASGVQSTLMLVKAAVYGLSLSAALVFVGGLAFATAFYYAGRHFSVNG